MNIRISQVYQEGSKYRFTISSGRAVKGYESESRKNASMARGSAIKTLKKDGHKIYQICG